MLKEKQVRKFMIMCKSAEEELFFPCEELPSINEMFDCIEYASDMIKMVHFVFWTQQLKHPLTTDDTIEQIVLRFVMFYKFRKRWNDTKEEWEKI